MKLPAIKGIDIELDLLVIPVVLLVLLSGYMPQFLLAYLSVFLHELGHASVGYALKARVVSFRFLASGLNACMEEAGSKSSQIVIYLSGPLVNILLSAGCMILNTYYLSVYDNMGFFISVNICLAIFNLLPVLPLDGGKILKTILAERVGLLSASSLMVRVSKMACLVLVGLGLVQFSASGYNVSFFLAALFIFLSLKSERTEAALMNAKYVVYRRSKLLKRGIYPARDLVVIKSVRLGDVLSSMDFDRFHIIHVLDENLRLVKTLTEQEVIDGVLRYDADTTFDKLIEDA